MATGSSTVSAPAHAGPAVTSGSAGYPNALDYIGYAGMHLACIGVFWTGVSWSYVLLCAGSYLFRMFGLVAGYHRYFAHRSFRTSRRMQFALALLGTLGVQKGVLWWTSHHRFHHRYSDTEHDLHSPIHQGFLYSHSGWFLNDRNRSTDYSRVNDLARFPELVWLDRHGLIPVVLYAAALFLLAGWPGLLWGFFVSTILLWHAIHAIGSFGHRFGGYRRFATADNSRNKWFLAIVLLGEGWHNNHHFYPGSARHGFAWWEIDITYAALRMMERLGLIWDLRLPPEQVRRADDARAQAHIRGFERWLQELRLRVLACVDPGVAGNASGDKPPPEVVKQEMEESFDAFGGDVVIQLFRDPVRLRASWSELRAALVRHAHTAGATDGGVALAATIEQELDNRLAQSALAHLFAPSRSAHGAPLWRGGFSEERLFR